MLKVSLNPNQATNLRTTIYGHFKETGMSQQAGDNTIQYSFIMAQQNASYTMKQIMPDTYKTQDVTRRCVLEVCQYLIYVCALHIRRPIRVPSGGASFFEWGGQRGAKTF